MSGSPWIVHDGFPYLGRSVVLGSKHAHLWGSSGSAPTGGDVALLNNVQGDIFVPMCTPPRGGLFQITAAAREIQRNFEEGLPAQPLSDQALGAPPAGVGPVSQRTQIALRITANDGTSLRQFDMDANQSIVVCAQNVCVWWIGPNGTVDVQNWTDAQRAAVTRTGFVFDAYLEVGVSRIECSPGDNSSVLLTQYLVSAAQSTPSIAIPAYAKEVTIYQNSQGAASAAWTQWIGDPNGTGGFAQVGVIPFIPGARKTQPSIELGHATHLQCDVDNDNARFFTLVWTIRP